MKKIQLASALLFGALATFSSAQAVDYQSVISDKTQQSIDVATGFYEDTLLYRNLVNIKKYIGRAYIQHAPFYGDGPEQLLSALEKELNTNPDVEVRLHRTIAEDDFVAIHSTWDYGSEIYVYVDIWRVEDGLLIEHWDHSQVVKPDAKPANNNTLYLGPDVNLYSEQNVERNRERAIDVLNVFDNLSDVSAAEKYVSAEQYIQHNPEVADGKQAFMDLFAYLADKKIRLKTTIAKTIAMGDMVMIHSKQVDLDNPDDLGTGYIDIFRFDEKGLIIEHWDIGEPVPSESKNTNGIFTYPPQ